MLVATNVIWSKPSYIAAYSYADEEDLLCSVGRLVVKGRTMRFRGDLRSFHISAVRVELVDFTSTYPPQQEGNTTFWVTGGIWALGLLLAGLFRPNAISTILFTVGFCMLGWLGLQKLVENRTASLARKPWIRVTTPRGHTAHLACGGTRRTVLLYRQIKAEVASPQAVPLRAD